jgi:hypothetical protein
MLSNETGGGIGSSVHYSSVHYSSVHYSSVNHSSVHYSSVHCSAARSKIMQTKLKGKAEPIDLETQYLTALVLALICSCIGKRYYRYLR